MFRFDIDAEYCKMSPVPLRVNDELRHNPYVGSFHGVSRPGLGVNSTLFSVKGVTSTFPSYTRRHNPHIGTFRHSPAADSLAVGNPFPLKMNLGFKGLLYEDLPAWQNSFILSQVQVARQKHYSNLHLPEDLLNQLIPFCSYSVKKFEVGDKSVSCSAHDNCDATHSCAICLDAFEEGCSVRKLPACGHFFHTGCIDTWLMGTHSDCSMLTAICPTCRCSATTSSEKVATCDEESTKVIEWKESEDIPASAFANLGRFLFQTLTGTFQKQEIISEVVVNQEGKDVNVSEAEPPSVVIQQEDCKCDSAADNVQNGQTDRLCKVFSKLNLNYVDLMIPLAIQCNSEGFNIPVNSVELSSFINDNDLDIESIENLSEDIGSLLNESEDLSMLGSTYALCGLVE